MGGEPAGRAGAPDELTPYCRGMRWTTVFHYGFFLGAFALGTLACSGHSPTSQADGDGGDLDGATEGGIVIVHGCQAGQSECGGSCVDTTSDSNHCGTCGNVCGSGTRCRNGMCVARPPRDASTDDATFGDASFDDATFEDASFIDAFEFDSSAD
jgi:hypothetical protein